ERKEGKEKDKGSEIPADRAYGEWTLGIIEQRSRKRAGLCTDSGGLKLFDDGPACQKHKPPNRHQNGNTIGECKDAQEKRLGDDRVVGCGVNREENERQADHAEQKPSTGDD